MEEKKLPEEEKKEEKNPLLDIVENDIDVEPDSVEVKVTIPFDLK